MNNVKLNFEAAFRMESGEGGWGFVARSDNSSFIAGVAGKLRNMKDALQADTEGCVAASEGAAALGFTRVIF
jgi:ribonuclease HI